MNIYLVGFMGTGKSAAGREVARLQKSRFIDLDELIEQKEKQAICEIFSQKGEPYFRQVEKSALAEIAHQNDLVVSCGGGIVLDQGNIDLMKQTGVMICLTAAPEVILARTRIFKHRPILNVKNPEEKIKALLGERAPYYAQAEKTIDTSKISVEQTGQMILEYLRTAKK